MPKCPSCKHELEQYPAVCKDSSNTECQCDDRWYCDVCKKFWYQGCVGHHYGADELDLETWH